MYYLKIPVALVYLMVTYETKAAAGKQQSPISNRPFVDFKFRSYDKKEKNRKEFITHIKSCYLIFNKTEFEHISLLLHFKLGYEPFKKINEDTYAIANAIAKQSNTIIELTNIVPINFNDIYNNMISIMFT